MPQGLNMWRALLAGALLALGLAAQADCSDGRLPHETDARLKVTRVFDGDTVQLEDGRRLRLIGINTPELGHGRGPDEPVARAARDEVERLLGKGDAPLLLEYGEDTYDHYGRLLAHAFLPDGRSLQVLLLRKGLAAAVTVPPNLRHAECYFASEAAARKAKRGVWKVAALGPVKARRLPLDARGFRILRGTVTGVSRQRRATRLSLDGRVDLLIYHDERRNFTQAPEALKGRRVEVRGWLSGGKGRRPRMRLRHGNNLRVLD
ncbi:MAG: thermonuclease family protein [Gammaproteobacteria bacterium]|nr:MAG: thermonuclease family protein [Gammaproteobacteria bacterium]